MGFYSEYGDNTPLRGMIFHIFEVLAQHERSLILSCSRRGRRSRKLEKEKIQSIINALESGQSKVFVYRTFQTLRARLASKNKTTNGIFLYKCGSSIMGFHKTRHHRYMVFMTWFMVKRQTKAIFYGWFYVRRASKMENKVKLIKYLWKLLV